MNTGSPQSTERRRPIRLRAMQTLVLPESDGLQNFLRIDVESGMLRLYALKSAAYADATLALMSPVECGKFRQPKNYQLIVEALTDINVDIWQEANFDSDEEDFLTQWLLELYIIRHPPKADDRFAALMKLFIERFGKRTTEGYKLEFLLSHHRIAEIIGTTRSTVSRTISRMRSQGIIAIDENMHSLTWNLNADRDGC